MKYGDLPKVLGKHIVNCQEMMFYQYLPIKLTGVHTLFCEDRLNPFTEIIGAACCDFVGEFGLNKFIDSYVYVSAKNIFQAAGCPYNRPGYHSDGFMTDDINYVWSNSNPTIFNSTDFNLSQDDIKSLDEMKDQALIEKDTTYDDNCLIRLNQFNIHKVNDNQKEGIRTFIKVSISKDKYDLSGNSINYQLPYKWDMIPRKNERNIPQSSLNNK